MEGMKIKMVNNSILVVDDEIMKRKLIKIFW